MSHNLLLSLFILIALDMSGGSPQSSSCVILTGCPHSLNISFLAKQDAPGSPCVFPDPALEFVISPKDSGSFSRERYLKTKIWILSVFIAIGVTLLLDSLRKQSWETYVCIDIPIPI